MSVTFLTRQQLSELLRHRDTSNIRKALSRGNLIENEDGLIDMYSPKNKTWISSQIKNAKRKGYRVDIDLSTKNDNSEAQPYFDIDTELKIARTDLIKEQIITTKINRDVIMGSYLRTDHVVESLTIYLDQTMNVANANMGNVAARFSREHGITKPEEIIKLKSDLTEALNQAIESGRNEVMKAVDRMVEEQREKLLK